MRGIALTAAALLVSPSIAAAEQGLLFDASFDGTLEALSTSGSGSPVTVAGEAEPTFAPGKHRQALVAGPEQALVHYSTEGNLIPQSGTVSLWLKPVDWRPEETGFHTFLEAGVHDGGSGWLLLYKYYQNGWMLLRYADERGQLGMATADNLGWQPDAWRHVAATWSADAMRIFVDGEHAAEAPAPLVAENLGEVVARHAQDAAYIELYDEPDNRDSWRGTPEESVEWTKWAAEEAREAAPDVPIVNGGYCLIEPEWTGFFARELRGVIDGVSHHSDGDVTKLEPMLEAMRAVHAAAGYEEPFFINTEMGYAAWRYDIERLQASTAVQKVLYCWAHGNRAALLFCSRRGGGPRLIKGDPDWGHIDHFMCPRFMYGAVAGLVDWYAGASYDPTLIETAQRHVYPFRADGKLIVGACSPNSTQPLALTSDATSALRVDPMGNASRMDDPAQVELTIGAYPTAIIFEGATTVTAT